MSSLFFVVALIIGRVSVVEAALAEDSTLEQITADTTTSAIGMKITFKEQDPAVTSVKYTIKRHAKSNTDAPLYTLDAILDPDTADEVVVDDGTGLEAGTEYDYIITTEDLRSSGTREDAVTSDPKTMETLPPVPQVSLGTGSTTTAINLKWDNFDAFVAAKSSIKYIVDGSEKTATPAATFALDDSLEAGTKYPVTVSGVKNALPNTVTKNFCTLPEKPTGINGKSVVDSSGKIEIVPVVNAKYDGFFVSYGSVTDDPTTTMEYEFNVPSASQGVASSFKETFKVKAYVDCDTYQSKSEELVSDELTFCTAPSKPVVSHSLVTESTEAGATKGKLTLTVDFTGGSEVSGLEIITSEALTESPTTTDDAVVTFDASADPKKVTFVPKDQDIKAPKFTLIFDNYPKPEETPEIKVTAYYDAKATCNGGRGEVAVDLTALASLINTGNLFVYLLVGTMATVLPSLTQEV